MIALFGCITLLLLSMLVASLRPIYSAATEKEFSRRAKKGDRSAQAIHRVVVYGSSVDTFLCLIAIILSSIGFTLVIGHVNIFVTPIIIGFGTFLIFYVLPKDPFGFSRKLAIKVSPYIASVLQKIKPILRQRGTTIGADALYEKEDLLELLQNQKSLSDNRIEAAELDLAQHVLTFGDKKVSNYMIPRSKVHMVSSEEPVGPILLSELYDSGFTCFPVYNENDDIVVGTLFLKDLVEKRATGIVSNVMSPSVYYVNDSAPLGQVLNAFTKTKHHMFIVVNDAVEIVGAITIQTVLEQALGSHMIDEFAGYDNMHQVATYKPSKKKP